MTRTQAICKLLRHGPLSITEAARICAWPQGEAEAVIATVHSAGLIHRLHGQKCNRTTFVLTKQGEHVARQPI